MRFHLGSPTAPRIPHLQHQNNCFYWIRHIPLLTPHRLLHHDVIQVFVSLNYHYHYHHCLLLMDMAMRESLITLYFPDLTCSSRFGLVVVFLLFCLLFWPFVKLFSQSLLFLFSWLADRRLHCDRNQIHLHLFVSCFLRSFFGILFFSLLHNGYFHEPINNE